METGHSSSQQIYLTDKTLQGKYFFAEGGSVKLRDVDVLASQVAT
jgi:hypothetical protein